MELYGSRLLVEVTPSENKTKSGLIIKDKAEKNRRGKVVKLGIGGDFEVCVGQYIIYDKSQEQEVDSNLVIIPQVAIYYYED